MLAATSASEDRGQPEARSRRADRRRSSMARIAARVVEAAKYNVRAARRAERRCRSRAAAALGAGRAPLSRPAVCDGIQPRIEWTWHRNSGAAWTTVKASCTTSSPRLVSTNGPHSVAGDVTPHESRNAAHHARSGREVHARGFAHAAHAFRRLRSAKVISPCAHHASLHCAGSLRRRGNHDGLALPAFPKNDLVTVRVALNAKPLHPPECPDSRAWSRRCYCPGRARLPVQVAGRACAQTCPLFRQPDGRQHDESGRRVSCRVMGVRSRVCAFAGRARYGAAARKKRYGQKQSCGSLIGSETFEFG